jgi:hypothetical protein
MNIAQNIFITDLKESLAAWRRDIFGKTKLHGAGVRLK